MITDWHWGVLPVSARDVQTPRSCFDDQVKDRIGLLRAIRPGFGTIALPVGVVMYVVIGEDSAAKMTPW